MLKIYICENQEQAATVVLREGRNKLVNAGDNPVLDTLIIDRDASGTEKAIRNYTGQSKYVLVFNI
jgi:hypothetical protein